VTFTIVILISVLSVACYFGLIFFFTCGWFSLKTTDYNPHAFRTTVSIIIPFRNEEENIEPLLKSLSGQQYPKELFEIILVDDHSTDHSYDIVAQFIKINFSATIKLFALDKSDGFSKKAALKKGVENSRGKLVVTTDADCIFDNNYLSCLVSFYEQNNCRLISGPVVFKDSKGLFTNLASLEFLSLIASGAGAISLNKPFLANGANFCFEHSLFEELNGYTSHDSYASGDDVFFLLQAKKHIKNKNKICFIKNRESIVTTQGPANLKEFIQQRVRWASKSPAYEDFFAKFTAGSVFFFNLALVLLLICGFIDFRFAIIAAIMFAGKLAVDLPLMFAAASFVKKKRLMWFYLPLQLIYPLYVVFIAISSLFVKVEWKGRKI